MKKSNLLKTILLTLPVLVLCGCDKNYEIDKNAFFCDDDGKIYKTTEMAGKRSGEFYICDSNRKKITGTIQDFNELTVKDGLVITETQYRDGVKAVVCDKIPFITGRPSDFDNCVNLTTYYPNGAVRHVRIDDGFSDTKKVYSENGELFSFEQRWNTPLGYLMRITFYKTNVGPINIQGILGEDKSRNRQSSLEFVTYADKIGDDLRPIPFDGYLEIFNERGEIEYQMNITKGLFNGTVISPDQSKMHSTIIVTYQKNVYDNGILTQGHSLYDHEKTMWISEIHPGISFNEENMILINGNKKVEFIQNGKIVGISCNDGEIITTSTKCGFEN
ncbi:hypothetical protein LJC18_05780 [Lachnospiraceae bacterium OttesenSCG-928-E19]|nr:hypothetical protein [Lachnospiraceae bacterium OttesenSCG-928-E19]